MLFIASRRISFKYFKTFCSYNLTQLSSEDYLVFKTGLSQEEQSKVLKVLNQANAEQLHSYNISKNRIKDIESWKSRKGQFKSLNDVLEVNGLGEKLLEKICRQIIENNAADVQSTSSEKKINFKYLRDLITPILPEKFSDIQSATGIHITPVGVSWARIATEDNKLMDWNYENLVTLPNKITPINTFNLAINLIRKMVPSDLYILENQMSIKQKSTIAFNQQMELSAMLLALLNTSVKHNMSINAAVSEDGKRVMENRVFFLKKRIAARLFGIIIGLETISSVAVVQNLLLKTEETSSITPISFDTNIKEFFEVQSSANKDLLGQSLLLTMSFLDLCIYKNRASLKTLHQNSFNKCKISKLKNMEKDIRK